MGKDIIPTQDAQVIEVPVATVARAKLAAVALQQVIASKPKPVVIRGEQYLEYEDWQLLGQFYGVAAQTGDAVPIDINGIRGAKASAKLYDIHTGQLLGGVGAEAYCMEDEEHWGGRPWHQLASMAQTRAGAKAFRNRFAWVVVLAGYKPTPAEEIHDDKEIKQQSQQQQLATDAQRKKIFACAKQMGYGEDEVKAIIKEKWGIESTNELAKSQASELIGMIERDERIEKPTGTHQEELAGPVDARQFKDAGEFLGACAKPRPDGFGYNRSQVCEKLEINDIAEISDFNEAWDRLCELDLRDYTEPGEKEEP